MVSALHWKMAGLRLSSIDYNCVNDKLLFGEDAPEGGIATLPGNQGAALFAGPAPLPSLMPSPRYSPLITVTIPQHLWRLMRNIQNEKSEKS